MPYDARDRITQVTHPGGTHLSYTYDAKGNRLTVTTEQATTSYTYDALSRLETVTAAVGTTTYTYDAVGNRDTVTSPNNAVTEYAYDDLNRLTYLENRTSSGSILSSYTYTLGLAGNRTRVVEASGRTVDYTYDDLYRLVEETITEAGGGGQTISYTYDDFGNRLSKTHTGGATTYAYDANDRLTSESSPAFDVVYEYDDNGNMVSKTTGMDTTVYAYDHENRLIGVTAPTETIGYAYDADGIRISKSVDGVRTDFLVDKNRPYAQVLEEYDDAGGLAASYVYGDDLICQNRSGVASFFHYDGQLSTRLLTDTSENVTDSYAYDAFGSLTSQTGATENSYQYTGEQYDPNVGLYYLRARYYSPGTGRFVTSDPWQGNAFEPVTLHKYLYANANPVLNADPTGLFTIMSMSGAIGIRNILSSVQIDFGFRILNVATGGGKDENGVDLLTIGLAFAGALPLVGNIGKWATSAGKSILKSKSSWLWKHEGIGHTIGKHVLVNNRWLRSRFLKESLEWSSRYKNIKIAEEVIEKAVLKENRRVLSWLKNGKLKGKLQFDYSGASKVIGYGYSKGSRKARKLYNARVVFPGKGTGYPAPSPQIRT